MAELGEIVTEAVADVAEGVAADALNVADISRSLSGRDLGIGLTLGLIIGSGAMFMWSRRVLEKKYNQRAEDEIAEMREHFRDKQRERERVSDVDTNKPSQEKPDLEKIVEERGYVPPPPGGLNVTASDRLLTDIRNAGGPKDYMIERELAEEGEAEFPRPEIEGWDFAAELAARTSLKPYILHEDEFKEKGYTAVSLTYYAGDDVLCDDSNMPIADKNNLVGDDNLAKFGHGSANPYLLYVRNEVLSIDMEIVLVSRSFVDEIQGLKHSDRRGSRRIRLDRET